MIYNTESKILEGLFDSPKVKVLELDSFDIVALQLLIFVNFSSKGKILLQD